MLIIKDFTVLWCSYIYQNVDFRFLQIKRGGHFDETEALGVKCFESREFDQLRVQNRSEATNLRLELD